MDNDQPDIEGNKLYDVQCQLTNGKLGRKTINVSDIILNKYSGLSGELRAVQIMAMEIRQKQLDKPISWLKSAAAFTFGVDTKHVFLLFQCQAQDQFVTVDYYDESRLVVRIGSLDMVLAANQSAKRMNSQIRQKSGVESRHQFKKGQYSIGELLELLIHKGLKPYKKVFKNGHNGKTFSEDIYNHIKNSVENNVVEYLN